MLPATSNCEPSRVSYYSRRKSSEDGDRAPEPQSRSCLHTYKADKGEADLGASLKREHPEQPVGPEERDLEVRGKCPSSSQRGWGDGSVIKVSELEA